MPYEKNEILNTLIRRVEAFSEGYRQNIAIFGEPCMGKTSIIKELLLGDSVKKEGVVPIYLEIKIEPFDFCAKRFLKASLYQLLKSEPLLTRALQDTVLLMEDLQKPYPRLAQLCSRVLQDIEKNRFDEAFSFMMDMPTVLLEEAGKKTIIILDEFHNFSNFPLKNPFGSLAKKIMIQKDAMYILVSSRPTLSQSILNEKLSLLFGNFEKIHIPPYNIAKSRNFLQQNIKHRTIPQPYLDFLASFCGNRPFYMKLISDEIERYSLSVAPECNDYPKLIEHALSETLFKETGLINQRFMSYLFKISDERLLSSTVSVLLTLSPENKKQNDIAKSSNVPAKAVSKILNRLLDMDVTVRNGSFYGFKDKLFSFWLQSAYLRKILSFSIDEQVEEAIFRRDIQNRIAIFLQEFGKNLSLRIIELFKSFRNDIIQLNGKKHRVLSFTDVQKLKETDDENIDILASNPRQKWLCTIRNRLVTENDVSDIIKNVKTLKRSNKIQRNVLVALAGINENAYLLAKEAKLWTWDLDSINTLMELYDKPILIKKEGTCD